MPAAIPIHASLQAVPDVLQSDVGDGIVLLHMPSSTYFALNPVGAAVWELLQKQRTVSEVVSELVEKFEVTSERCQSEVLDLLSQLRDAALVEVRDVTHP